MSNKNIVTLFYNKSFNQKKIIKKYSIKLHLLAAKAFENQCFIIEVICRIMFIIIVLYLLNNIFWLSIYTLGLLTGAEP